MYVSQFLKNGEDGYINVKIPTKIDYNSRVFNQKLCFNNFDYLLKILLPWKFILLANTEEVMKQI